jgi:hypothetical protein
MSARPRMLELPFCLLAKFNQNRSLQSLGISPVPRDPIQVNFLKGVDQHQKKVPFQGPICLHILPSRPPVITLSMIITEGQKETTKHVLAGIQPMQRTFVPKVCRRVASRASHTSQTFQEQIVRSSAFFSFLTKGHKTRWRIWIIWISRGSTLESPRKLRWHCSKDRRVSWDCRDQFGLYI